MFERLRALRAAWETARLSKTALGKYIILFASGLHLGWAALLVIDPRASGATPLHIIWTICGGRWRTAVVLGVTAIAAGVFPFARSYVGNVGTALMLIPQQMLLFMSAGAGLYASFVEHYADGVLRSWVFILADQLPVILVSLLYSAAVIEAAFDPPDRALPHLSEAK